MLQALGNTIGRIALGNTGETAALLIEAIVPLLQDENAAFAASDTIGRIADATDSADVP